MGGVIEKTFRPQSMPVHNPLFGIGPVRFRANISKAAVPLENPKVIASLIPEPLLFSAPRLFIVLLEVTELKVGFSEDDTPWSEIGIQVEVTYKENPWLYVFEVYSGNIRNILSGRERFGYPKIPGHLSVVKSARGVDATLLKDGSRKGILHFSYTVLPPPTFPDSPPRIGSDKKDPRIVLFKCIPSPVMGELPEVRQLVTIRYGKPVIHNLTQAEGSIEVLEGAPAYLKEAGLKKPQSISCLDMETEVVGGERLHQY